MKKTILNTSRLSLREFIKDDYKQVHIYASDSDVAKYMVWGPNNEKDTIDYIERVVEQQKSEPRLKYELAIMLQSDILIGACNLTITSLNNRNGFIGYCLNKKYWNKGYATEVSNTLLDFGFKELKLHRIYATCDKNNIGSKKVLEKIGMKQEGLMREDKIINGKWRDSYIYSILEQEYESKRGNIT